MYAAAQPQTDSATLLVVDDDRDIRHLLANSLGARGYRVETASSARDMDQMLARTPIDCVILDIMMPGEDGLSACRRIAKQRRARSHPAERARRGAGPYPRARGRRRAIIFPSRAARARSSPRCARRCASAARSPRPRAMSICFEGWRIDLGSHELFDPDGVLVGLTDGEFAVLRVFIERPRRVLSREALLRRRAGPIRTPMTVRSTCRSAACAASCAPAATRSSAPSATKAICSCRESCAHDPAGSAARSPLFLRIFLLMLVCVAVTQLHQLAAAGRDPDPSPSSTPSATSSTPCSRADDPGGELRDRRGSPTCRAPWNPRGERIQMALATGAARRPTIVEISFRHPS
jgi:two-component system OmpR family response regulator